MNLVLKSKKQQKTLKNYFQLNMANLLLLKKRIQTAQNVSKTTKALQMISTSKLKKAQDAAVMARPYVEKLDEISRNLTTKVEKQALHPYMEANSKADQPLLILITPDKGLCGGMLSNLIREALSFNDKFKPYFITVGKKGEAVAAKISGNVLASFPFGTSLPSFDMVFPIIRIIDEYFLSKKVSSVKILTTKFVNLFTQNSLTIDLLPVEIDLENEQDKNPYTLFEPNITEILSPLLKQHIEMVLYQSLLEAYASEQGARAISMKNATDNAATVIQDLRLEYNKKRQEKITNEILDISGSAVVLANE
jgi:F-type H+-transporting ATPase subunit gamma